VGWPSLFQTGQTLPGTLDVVPSLALLLERSDDVIAISASKYE
jgi:hypothetical protein